MSAYVPPEWIQSSLSPQQREWKLDEIKSGVVVATHSLTQSLVTFGRDPSIPFKNSLSIITAHESCSRLHARIAFDKQGNPWLRDLKSGNGTKVNKKPLPLKSIGKSENLNGPGSRGVVLFPGDIVQFGASTRVYVVEGPKEFERGARKAIRQQQATLNRNNVTSIATEKERIKNEVDNTNEISWGMKIDCSDRTFTEGNQDQLANSTSTTSRSDLPKQNRKLLEKTRAKKYKLSNIQLEMKRIENKSSSVDLSDGQIKQLESLQQREKQILQEISELDQRMNDNLVTKRDNTAKRKRIEDEDDVDDFYDRTNNKNHSKSEWTGKPTTETEESLITRCQDLFQQLQRNDEKVTKLQLEKKKIENLLQKTRETDEDYFFVKNDLKLATDDVKAASDFVQSINEEMDEIEKLLRVANDKIVVDRKAMFVGSDEAYNSLTDDSKDNINDKMSMPPPQINVPSSNNTWMLPPKRLPLPKDNGPFSANGMLTSRVDQNTSDTLTNINVPETNTQSRKQVRGPARPPQGILSFISQSRNTEVNTDKLPGRMNMEMVKTKSVGSTFNSKKDEWVAPKGQDGSGMTKLNKKFGY